jgi:hypothetical protein
MREREREREGKGRGRRGGGREGEGPNINKLPNTLTMRKPWEERDSPIDE